jgi:hypothetical protein
VLGLESYLVPLLFLYREQVMPQLLHFLGVEARTEVKWDKAPRVTQGQMDWGTLAVYTCTRSCGGAGYKDEFVWRQAPLA